MWDKPENGVSTTNHQEVSEEAKLEIEREALAHKEAQDALSKKAEELINTNMKLAELNPKSILDMDTKMQNKVIKKLYWYGNIDELKLIHGEEFYKKTEGWEEVEKSEIEQMKQKMKILEYNNQKDKFEAAIDEFKKENESALNANEGSLEKIIKETEYISSSLPAKERIMRASKIVLGTNFSEDAAYLLMQERTKGNSGLTKWTTTKEVPKNTDMDNIFDAAINAAKRKRKY